MVDSICYAMRKRITHYTVPIHQRILNYYIGGRTGRQIVNLMYMISGFKKLYNLSITHNFIPKLYR